jgi:hypothetical protein
VVVVVVDCGFACADEFETENERDRVLSGMSVPSVEGAFGSIPRQHHAIHKQDPYAFSGVERTASS